MNHRSSKLLGVLLVVAAAVVGFGNWRSSPLHRYVCGPDLPYAINLKWLLIGERMLEGWPAKLCGCTPPPGYAEHQELVRFRLDGSSRFSGSDSNIGALSVADGAELLRYLRSKQLIAAAKR